MSSGYIGDFTWGQTVRGFFPSRLATGARGDFSDALEVADIRVYKNGSATERSSTSGFGITSTFDSLTGITSWSVDMSDNTDAGFYVPGEYALILYPSSETLSSLDVSSVLATWSFLRPTMLMPIIGLAQGGTSTTVRLPAAASNTDGAYAGAMVYVRHASGNVEIFPQSSVAYVGSTRTLTIDGTFATTPDTTSYAAPLLGPVAGSTVLPDVNVAQVNAVAIDGAGTAGDPWGPV